MWERQSIQIELYISFRYKWRFYENVNENFRSKLPSLFPLIITKAKGNVVCHNVQYKES